MGKLILVRHCHTIMNTPAPHWRLRGWVDVPLDDQGFAEAITTAQRIAQFPVESIYTSDLLRAKQTAESIRNATKAALVATRDLRPWNLGRLGGEAVQDALPLLDRLYDDPLMPAPGGESFREFYVRFSQLLWSLMDLAEKSSKCIVAVTHVRNLLACPTIILGGDWTQIPVSGGPPLGSVIVVDQKEGGWVLSVNHNALHEIPHETPLTL
jgi:probable phosphoglycerate mutase